MQRKCTSLNTTVWSTHSRRIEPMSRSAYAFCQGERAEIGRSRMPIARTPAFVDVPVASIAISHQVPRCRVPRERICYLPADPFSHWMGGDAESNQLPGLMPQNYQPIQQFEKSSRITNRSIEAMAFP
jgi:hypothetical protein